MSTNKKRLVSGIQTSGRLHLGNYLGALSRFSDLQDEYQSYFFLADLHAVTAPQKPEALRKHIRHVAAAYIACGLDPKKSLLFRQSDVSEHAELGWLLTTLSTMGELKRMTQYKDKGGNTDSVGVGIFTYPSLMAADILLYQADAVPVGDDQKQHIELTRNLADRFNQRFGETFTVPEPLIAESAPRIMGLDDPAKKMSKSAASEYNYISLTDDPDTVTKKVKKAVTDSGSEVKGSGNGPAITNLITIYAGLSGESKKLVTERFAGDSYGDFKKALTEQIIATLEPIRLRMAELEEDSTQIEKILADGAAKAQPEANKTLQVVKTAMGLN
jgi:tryptophanyl-tRNA synthetase